jgi:excisionase family DNA binding protein
LSGIDPLPERLFTQEEVAARLRVADITVYRLRRSGALGYLRLGDGGRSGVRFSEQHIAAYLADREAAAVERTRRQRPPTRKEMAPGALGRVIGREISIRDRLHAARKAGDNVAFGKAMAQLMSTGAGKRSPAKGR